MVCPTCSHQMHFIGIFEHSKLAHYWCPRCGTLKTSDERLLPGVPKLVERCREYEKGGFMMSVGWHRYGIKESIYPEENR